MVTPVSSQSFSILSFFIFSLARKPILKSYSSTDEVPIEGSVKRNERAEAPENPTHFTDHPNVGFSHVVSNMEHHFAQIRFNIIIIVNINQMIRGHY
jgi:hypothetical protein